MTSSVLDRARAGDEQAFGELTEPYARELRVHCYRLLGSLTDAEDVLQETWVAAWRGLGGFAGRSSLRTWLYRVATNRCLNARCNAQRRLTPEPVPPFAAPEPTRRDAVTWLQPYPDELLERVPDPEPGPAAVHETRADVELGFVTALQRLPPRQIAVVVLSDVLGFGQPEVAQMLKVSPTVVKGLRQRGRAGLARHHDSAHRPAGGAGSATERDLAARFTTAFTAGDVDAVVMLLTDQAWLAMPPAPHTYVGPAAVAEFFRASFGWRRNLGCTLLPTRANGQPALGCYYGETDHASTRTPAGLIVLTMTGSRIGGITGFLYADLQRWFGLPATVLAD